MTSIFMQLTTLLIILTLLACSTQGDWELVESAADGNLERVQIALANAHNIDAHAVDGWTALTIAAREGHTEVVKFLLEHGADVNAPEDGGNSPIFWATFHGHIETVKLLLSGGADSAQKCSRDGCESPLEIARRCKYYKIEELLAENKLVTRKMR